MHPLLPFFGAIILFLLGLRLSAFFSGSETGFYRVSFLRVSLDAHSGDRTARQILWFAQNPAYFVATTLVGNNVANYITTLAIGFAVIAVSNVHSGWMEIVGTLFISPLVFIFGELIPKNLYYRAPLFLLRKEAAWFLWFYRLFFVVSFPLIGITKLVERFGSTDDTPTELVLGRSRLVQVLSQGHREGLLSDVQNRLIDGLMQTAEQPVVSSMTPLGRVLGVSNNAGRDEILDVANRFGLSSVAVRNLTSADSWYGYIRVADLAITGRSPAGLIRPMPQITAETTKLEAVLTLRNAGESFAVVRDGQAVTGIVSERGLIEQLFRPAQTLGAAFTAGTRQESTVDSGLE